MAQCQATAAVSPFPPSPRILEFGSHSLSTRLLSAGMARHLSQAQPLRRGMEASSSALKRPLQLRQRDVTELQCC